MIYIDVHDAENFVATFEFDNKLISIIKQLPNRTYDKKIGAWIFPIIDLFILKKLVKIESIELDISKAANKKYLEVAEAFKKIRDIADAVDSDYKIHGLKRDVKLYPFQRVGIEYLDSIRDGLVGFDMGLGKSIMGISIAANAFHDKSAKQVLIVCPASLKYEWAYQIAKFSNFAYTIVGGKDREAQYRKKTPFIIVNYDLLYRDIELIKDIDWDIVICDEIQRARNYKTDTVKALLQLKCKRKIGLTGTPIENDLMDLFTIMKFLNPKIFGKNVTSFIGRYCTLDYFGRINHDKYKNLDEVTKKISFSMIRRKKRDVLDDLPEKVVNHFYINLSQEEMRKYKEIKSGILEDINSGKIKTIAALAQVGYLRQACDALNLVVENSKIISSKLDEVKQIIKDLPADSKIVIFSQYERMAKIIEDHIGYKSVHLHGGVENGCKWEGEIEEDTLKKHKKLPQEELDVVVYEERLKAVCQNCPYYNDESKCHTRKKIVSQFNNEKDIKLFISTDAGKAGLNLQVANVVINYDMSFNPAVNEQRIARIDRIGQLSAKILVINLICVDTIEEKVLKILEKKQLLFDKVIDGADEGEAMKIIFNEQNIKDLL
jgi:SNF2 family DNA or RNA helicase